MGSPLSVVGAAVESDAGVVGVIGSGVLGCVVAAGVPSVGLALAWGWLELPATTTGALEAVALVAVGLLEAGLVGEEAGEDFKTGRPFVALAGCSTTWSPTSS